MRGVDEVNGPLLLLALPLAPFFASPFATTDGLHAFRVPPLPVAVAEALSMVLLIGASSPGGGVIVGGAGEGLFVEA